MQICTPRDPAGLPLTHRLNVILISPSWLGDGHHLLFFGLTKPIAFVPNSSVSMYMRACFSANTSLYQKHPRGPNFGRSHLWGGLPKLDFSINNEQKIGLMKSTGNRFENRIKTIQQEPRPTHPHLSRPDKPHLRPQRKSPRFDRPRVRVGNDPRRRHVRDGAPELPVHLVTWARNQ